MELDEFKILQRETSPGDHGVAVTSAGVRRGAREVSSAVASSGEDGIVGSETVEGAVFLVVSHNADALSFVVHDEVHSEILDEEVCVVAKRLLGTQP